MRRKLWIGAMAAIALGAAAGASPTPPDAGPLICLANGSTCTNGRQCCGGECVVGCITGTMTGLCNSTFSCPS